MSGFLSRGLIRFSCLVYTKVLNPSVAITAFRTGDMSDFLATVAYEALYYRYMPAYDYYGDNIFVLYFLSPSILRFIGDVTWEAGCRWGDSWTRPRSTGAFDGERRD